MSSDLANRYASSFYQTTSRSQAMQWLQRADAGDHEASVLQHVHTRATRRIPGLDRFKAFKGLFNSEADPSKLHFFVEALKLQIAEHVASM